MNVDKNLRHTEREKPEIKIGTRVKTGKFGQSAKFGQRPCFFYLNYCNKKLTKQTVKILMRRLLMSHLDFHCLLTYVRIYPLSEVT